MDSLIVKLLNDRSSRSRNDIYIKHILLGTEPPEKHVRTGVLENHCSCSLLSKAGYHNGSWCTVESDVELMKVIAEAIKSGKIPNISVLSQKFIIFQEGEELDL